MAILLTFSVLFVIVMILYTAFSDSTSDTNANITERDEESVEYIPVSKAGEEGESEVDMTVSFHLPSFKVIRNLYVLQGGGRATEIDIVLVHNSGIYVLEVKNHSGWIFGHENQRYWTETYIHRNRMYRHHYRHNTYVQEKHQFYNPLMQNRGHINSLQRFLGINPDLFHSYIVFTGDCELKSLTFNSAFHKVVKREWLVSQINEDVLNYGSLLSDDEVASIYERLRPLTNPSLEQRREQIRTYQTAKSRDDDSGIRCPLCGGHLVARRNKSTGNPFWGCSNYPRCRYTRKYVGLDRQQSGRMRY